MPSISHRTDPGHGILQRAKSGLAALPAGIVRGPIRWIAERFGDWREPRQLAELDDHLLRDIGLSKVDARWSIIAPRYDRNLKP